MESHSAGPSRDRSRNADPRALPASTEIAIVGGGMVGLSLAILFAQQLKEARILVIEAFPLETVGSDSPEAEIPPSFDARVTALGESSREIFQTLGVWQHLAPYLSTIGDIQVSNRDHPGATRLNARDINLPALGYVVENRHLGRTLLGRAKACDNIQILAPAKVDRLIPVSGGMEIGCGGQHCRASLAVIADGANSAMLRQLGIHTQCTDYQQTAVIANIALSTDPGGVAYERFTNTGPIALLPLQSVDGEPRAALIWSVPRPRADQLLTAGVEEFLSELHQLFGYRAGRFIRCGQRSAYPLRRLAAQEQVRSHLAVVGNAAHTLHPVAGQGFNLALRDIARLAEVVAAGRRRGEELGSLTTLERYLEAQRADQRNTTFFSHILPTIFGDHSPVAVALRNVGLIALDLAPWGRRGFASFGAGLAEGGVKIDGG